MFLLFTNKKFKTLSEVVHLLFLHDSITSSKLSTSSLAPSVSSGAPIGPFLSDSMEQI